MAAWDNPIAEIRRLEREVSRLREVVARVEALASHWESIPEPPSEDYDGTTEGHYAFGEWLATWANARALRNAIGGAS